MRDEGNVYVYREEREDERERKMREAMRHQLDGSLMWIQYVAATMHPNTLQHTALRYTM